MGKDTKNCPSTVNLVLPSERKGLQPVKGQSRQWWKAVCRGAKPTAESAAVP